MATPTTPDKTPEWMLLLEKKKNRPHRLAHEIGAGAPCLTCGEKCPGLDLHFWRKVCRNCKCKKEDHDVKDDDNYAQFEILLGAGSKRKTPGAVLKIKVPEVVASAVAAGKGGVPFDWVPPNVSDDVAAEYMQQLPAAKLPISGSDGALYRRQQLERQMPLHDLDAGLCHNLTPEEIKELKKYLDNLKSNVVGQGRVSKVPTLYTEQRHTYRGPTLERNTMFPNTSLHSSYSDQSLRSLPPLPNVYNAVPRPFQPHSGTINDKDLPPPLPDSLPPDYINSNLKTPSSFLQSKGSGALTREGSLSSVAYATPVPGQKYPGSTDAYTSGMVPQDGSTSSMAYSKDIAFSSALPGQIVPGFSQQHHQPGGHASGVPVFQQDGSLQSSQVPYNIARSTDASGNVFPAISQSLNKYPAATISGKPEDGLFIHSQDPYNIASSTGAPLPRTYHAQNTHHGGSSYGKPRDGSFVHSQDPYNIASSTGAPLPGTYHAQNTHHAGSSYGVPQDGLLIHSQDPYNVASSTGVFPGISQSQGLHHASPSVQGSVSTISEPTHNNPHSNQINSGLPPSQNPHTQRSNAETLRSENPYKISNSDDVGGLLNSNLSQNTGQQGNYSDAANFVTHPNRLDIPGSLAHAQLVGDDNWRESSQMPEGMRYDHSLLKYDVSQSSDIHGNSMPLSARIIQQSSMIDNELAPQLGLLTAQEQSTASNLSCKHCTEPLLAGDVAVFADRAGDTTAWHPNCFVCNTCDELLVDLIYFFSKGNVYCLRHFAEYMNIPRCFACDELIFVNEYTVAEGKTFHVKHFCCYECDDPLAGKQYVPANDQPTCLDCYQEIFGKRCHTCRKQIAVGQRGVVWKELNWHAEAECFRCSSCSKSLLGGKFVMSDEQPFCNKGCVTAAEVF